MEKIRVVVDTNVIVSGIFWLGPSHAIIKLIEENNMTLIVSHEILEEYFDVLNYDEIKRKVQHHEERIEAFQKLVQIGELVSPKEMFDVVKDDPDDNMFLEAAVEGDIDYIISQDKHVLKIKEFRGIKIVTPEEFLETLKNR